jgi:hypothetical protein
VHLLGVVISVGFLVDGPNVVVGCWLEVSFVVNCTVVCTVDCVCGAVERLSGIKNDFNCLTSISNVANYGFCQIYLAPNIGHNDI